MSSPADQRRRQMERELRSELDPSSSRPHKKTPSEILRSKIVELRTIADRTSRSLTEILKSDAFLQATKTSPPGEVAPPSSPTQETSVTSSEVSHSASDNESQLVSEESLTEIDDSLIDTVPLDEVVESEIVPNAEIDDSAPESATPYRFDELTGEIRLDAETVLETNRICDTSVGDEIDKILEGDSRPVERFLSDLEEKLINGESRISIRSWARRTHGVSTPDFNRFEAIIRATWRVEGTSYFVLQQRRDHMRQMYMSVFRKSIVEGAVDPKMMKCALEAVDALAKLEGFVGPNVAVQINTGAGASTESTKEQLTNKTREQTMILLQKMRDRSEARSHRITEKLTTSDTTGQKLEVASDGVEIEKLDAPSPMVMSVVR